MADLQILTSQQLAAANAAEVDVQIATAHKYPRNVSHCLSAIQTLAVSDPETAASCFYRLERGGKAIEGLSVRMAEIIASQWRNLRVAARVVSNDGKAVVVEAVAHDLETNVAICTQTQRRITDRHGNTYSDDMQVIATNAALAIARRNAILQVVPKAITAPIVEAVKRAAEGKAAAEHSPEVVAKMLQYLEQQGVSEVQVLQYLERDCVDSITPTDVLTLRAVANAVREGSTSWADEFGAVAVVASNTDKAKAAIAAKLAANSPKSAPQTEQVNNNTTAEAIAPKTAPNKVGIVAQGGTATPTQSTNTNTTPRKSLI